MILDETPRYIILLLLAAIIAVSLACAYTVHTLTTDYRLAERSAVAVREKDIIAQGTRDRTIASKSAFIMGTYNLALFGCSGSIVLILLTGLTVLIRINASTLAELEPTIINISTALITVIRQPQLPPPADPPTQLFIPESCISRSNVENLNRTTLLDQSVSSNPEDRSP